MPDKDGYHDTAFEAGGRMWRWHYCEGANADSLVLDTPREMKKHLRACQARQRADKMERALEADRHRREALAMVRRERQLAR